MRLSSNLVDVIQQMIDEGRAKQLFVAVEDDSPLFTERPLSQSEAAFSREVIGAAQARGWLVAHFRPARVLNADGSTGWRTPVEADGAGFPDLVLVRERVLFIELKSNKGRSSPAQKRWCKRLTDAGAIARVVRPRDFQALLVLLDRQPGGSP